MLLLVLRFAAPFAPTTVAEMRERGWDAVDVVFVTGDAYVDHPSFAMAILARVLESAGYRVAMLSQPDWHSCEPWRSFGRPRLFRRIGLISQEIVMSRTHFAFACAAVAVATIA